MAEYGSNEECEESVFCGKIVTLADQRKTGWLPQSMPVNGEVPEGITSSGGR